jgi:predicted metal-binding membrane protein
MTQTTQTPERKLNLGRLERLQRLLQYGAALVLLVFVALIALAWTELSDLNKRRDKAREALTKAEQELAAVNGELALKKNALEAAQSVNSVL